MLSHSDLSSYLDSTSFTSAKEGHKSSLTSATTEELKRPHHPRLLKLAVQKGPRPNNKHTYDIMT